MVGFVLVFVFGNIGYGGVDWKRYSSVMGKVGVWYGSGVERDMGGAVCCLFEVPERCNCQVNIL